MTLGDLYTTVCLLGMLFTPVLLGCWAWERHGEWVQRWGDYRQARRDRKAMAHMRSTNEFQDLQHAFADLSGKLGEAFMPPVQKMVQVFNDIAKALGFEAAPPGTVQNPSDPSPRPRVRRLIDSGIAQQDRRAYWRTQAEGETQR